MRRDRALARSRAPMAAGATGCGRGASRRRRRCRRGGGARPRVAAWTSRSTIRPSGPVPAMARGSRPASAASRLARGLIRSATRPPPAAPGRSWSGGRGDGRRARSCGGRARMPPRVAAGAGAARRCDGAAAGRRRRRVGDRLAGGPDPAADGVDRDGLAFLRRRVARRTPSSNALDLHRALVGLDLEQDVAPVDGVALLACATTVRTHSSVIWPGFGIRIGWTIGRVPRRSGSGRSDEGDDGGDDVVGVRQEGLLEALRLRADAVGAAPIRPTGPSR